MADNSETLSKIISIFRNNYSHYAAASIISDKFYNFFNKYFFIISFILRTGQYPYNTFKYIKESDMLLIFDKDEYLNDHKLQEFLEIKLAVEWNTYRFNLDINRIRIFRVLYTEFIKEGFVRNVKKYQQIIDFILNYQYIDDLKELDQ